MVAIVVRGVEKRIGDAPILKGIDLRIDDGELFFLLGPSGCGKTTLLRHIAGFHVPDQGSILFDGRDVTRVPPHRRETAMMFQSYALWPHLTVGENVAFGLTERRRPKGEIRLRVAEALAQVHLAGYEDRKIQQLSGGQQQRVALARALVVRPGCLLLDEPLSNLDAQLRLEMRSEIRRICKESGLTGVYVTHDQEEALSMADRLAVMDGGQLVQIGSPQEVYRNPVSRMVAEFIGETNFIPGDVLGPGTMAGQFRVGTPAGVLIGRVAPGRPGPEVGHPVWLSARPEALNLAGDNEAPNRVCGRILDSVYLGSSAQYRLDLGGGLVIKVSEANPSMTMRGPGEHAVATISPDDLVLLGT